MTTTTMTQPKTDFQQFYQDILQTPGLQGQLKAAMKAEDFELQAITLASERGYQLTLAEFQALETVEAVLQQLYQSAMWDSQLRQQLKTVTSPQGLCQLAIRWTEQQGAPFNPAEIQAALAMGAAMEEADVEEEKFHYYPQIAAICLC